MRDMVMSSFFNVETYSLLAFIALLTFMVTTTDNAKLKMASIANNRMNISFDSMEWLMSILRRMEGIHNSMNRDIDGAIYAQKPVSSRSLLKNPPMSQAMASSRAKIFTLVDGFRPMYRQASSFILIA